MSEIQNLTELEFRREENKFFVPRSHSKAVNQSIEALTTSLHCEKETHTHPITRSAYYYFDDTDSLPPGFSVRYREYVDKTIESGDAIGSDGTGFYEVKWLDQYESGRPIKKKIRIVGKFENTITHESLRAMVQEHLTGEQSSGATLSDLDKQFTFLAHGGFQSLRPLFVTEYVRNRYIHLAGNKKNVVTVDNDVTFYRVTPDNSAEGEFSIQPLGKIDGCVVEYKESSDDIKLRWQLYRTLVKNNATRFYGKKGEALNLLQRERSKDAPLIRNELPNLEIEVKVDVLTNVARTFQFVTDAFNYFNTDSLSFTITPGFHWINSQSTMARYGRNTTNPNSENKLLVGLNAKYSEKTTLESDNGILVRTEYKGSQFEFNRADAREKMRDTIVVGNTQRIRRAFYISSQKTERVYKVSVDFNWKLPIQDNDFFSQLEVEYTGIPVKLFQGSTEYCSPTFDEIKKEVGQVRDEIVHLMESLGISQKVGSSKVQMLTS